MAGKGRRTFGSVRQLASGRWQARYLDAAGIRHTAPRTFPSKVDATRCLAQVEADLLRGSWADPKLGRVTFGEWVEQWRPTTANLRPGTLVLYDYQLRRFLLPAFGSVPLGRLDTMTVRLLRRILNVAVEAGYLPRNPCTVKGAGIERAEMRHASIPQLHELADAVPARYRALILLAGYGGLRWAELVGLRRHHVDLAGARVQVVEQAAEVAGKIIVSPPKTEAGRRVVTLPRIVVEALAEHLRSTPSPGLMGWYSRRRRVPTCYAFNRFVWRPAVQVGPDGLRVHDLRHTAATLAAAAGATTKELMERMGHASPTVALRYQHVMADRQAALVLALDDLARLATVPVKGMPRARKGTQRARRRR